MVVAAAVLAGGAALVPYQVVGDSIPASLTGHDGDPARGRALMLTREVSTCLLCHGGPFPEEAFQGDVGPTLSGVGGRLSPGQIRLRIVDAAAVNPDTVMPRFYTTAGLTRVGHQWEGKPALSADQIEDIVAFLATLRAP
jgi:sulfur-oxidizing protein SoxX